MKALKEEYPVKNRMLNFVAYGFILLTVVAVAGSVYIQINRSYYEQQLMIDPVFLLYYVLAPLNFLGIAFVAVWIFDKLYLKNNTIVFAKKGIRIFISVVCACVILLYFFQVFAFRTGFTTIPAFLLAMMFFEKASYLFAPIGILLFLGLKS